MKKVIGRFDITLNKTSALVPSLETDLKVILTCGQEELLALKNQTEILQELLISGDNSTRSMRNDILHSNHELFESFKEIESIIPNRSTETLSQLMLSSSDLRAPGGFTLKSCQKVAGLSAPDYLSPYVLINPDHHGNEGLMFPHLCDTLADGGGWMIIQSRSTGNFNFNRRWADYKNGFGSFYDVFWLGNEEIHAITRNGTYELEIILRYNEKTGFAHFENFFFGDESTNYRLSIGEYYGTAGDSLTHHNGMPFSTIDKDNDEDKSSCTSVHGGGWWLVV